MKAKTTAQLDAEIADAIGGGATKKPAKPEKPKRPAEADNLRLFGGEVNSFRVGESARSPGEVQICQYASSLVGPLSPTAARALAANLIAAADAIEAAR